MKTAKENFFLNFVAITETWAFTRHPMAPNRNNWHSLTSNTSPQYAAVFHLTWFDHLPHISCHSPALVYPFNTTCLFLTAATLSLSILVLVLTLFGIQIFTSFANACKGNGECKPGLIVLRICFQVPNRLIVELKDKGLWNVSGEMLDQNSTSK